MTKIQKSQQYLTKLFDGVFSEQEINTQRARVFYRIANFTSPTTGKTVGDTLSNDQIGEVINSLSDLQFNRRMQAKVQRMGECPM